MSGLQAHTAGSVVRVLHVVGAAPRLPPLLCFLLQVCLVTPAAEEGRTPLPSSGMLAKSLGVAMQPYLEGTSRVVVATDQEAPATVLQLIQQADTTKPEAGKKEALEGQ